MIFYVFLVVILILCLRFIYTRRHLYFISWQLPGPFAWPIIGNAFLLMGDSKGLLKKILQISKPYSTPFRLWLGPRLVIFIKDADQLQVTMQSSKFTTKAFVYKFLEPFFGKGLFTSTGTKHKNDRKLLQPLYGPKLVEGYSIIFEKHAKKLVNVLEEFVDKESFDVLHYIHDAAFEESVDILIEEKHDIDVDYKAIPGYIRRFYHIFIQRCLKFWLISDNLFKLNSLYKEQQMMVAIFDKVIEHIKNERIPEITKRLEFERDASGGRIQPIMEMMAQLIIDDPNCLTETDVKDHMITFFGSSQDTQSSAIAFTLMMLGIYKDIQRKVFEELKEVLDNRKIIYLNDTLKLKYMEMCIKEAMRLFPLGPFLPRDVIEEYQLGKYKIPKNCTVILGVYHVHRDPKHWEKPEEYYPEHFTDEACSKRHPYAYLAFSGGPRRCIAQQYSFVNMKIIIGNILLNYVVDSPGKLKELELITDISIRPINGYMIKISKRI